jgi:acyl-coenzyme A thioesterase PaaI-like protein
VTGAPDLDPPVAPARLRLAASTRALVEAVGAVHAGADDATLDATAAAIEAATTALAASGSTSATGTRTRAGGYAGYLPSSLLVGRAHPLSPAGTATFADGVLEVRARFGPAYEGPPGAVHGGIVALAFDELFGMCTVCNGRGAVTGRLSVRYRHPTPLHEQLRLRAWVEHAEGRRVRVRGTIHAGDTLTAEADGLFVVPPPRFRADARGSPP